VHSGHPRPPDHHPIPTTRALSSHPARHGGVGDVVRSRKPCVSSTNWKPPAISRARSGHRPSSAQLGGVRPRRRSEGSDKAFAPPRHLPLLRGGASAHSAGDTRLVELAGGVAGVPATPEAGSARGTGAKDSARRATATLWAGARWLYRSVISSVLWPSNSCTSADQPGHHALRLRAGRERPTVCGLHRGRLGDLRLCRL
jgi:hypothetical protein